MEQSGAIDRTYKMKVWEDGAEEPTGWLMDETVAFDAPATGSFGLLAHLTDVTFHDITITEIEGGDVMKGGEGNDVLSAVDVSDPLPGAGELDVFLGDGGDDVFVLADGGAVFMTTATLLRTGSRIMHISGTSRQATRSGWPAQRRITP